MSGQTTQSNKREFTVLVDGDIIAYRCGFACEKKHYTLLLTRDDQRREEEEMTFVGKREMNAFLKETDDIAAYEWESELVVEPLSFCLSTVKHMLSNIKTACKATAMKVYLSDKENYRNDIATIAKYKGNRDDQRKPLHHAEVIKYLKKYTDVVQVDRMEADDLLAEDQRTWNEAGRDTCIASIDKDLLQIPGKHYNFVKEEFLIVTPPTAVRNLYEQVLKGDRTDNIPGIKGIGDKTATQILKDCTTEDEMYDECVAQWREFLLENCDWAEYDGAGAFSYTGHDGEECSATVEEIVDEVKRLLTVGVPQGGDDDA